MPTTGEWGTTERNQHVGHRSSRVQATTGLSPQTVTEISAAGALRVQGYRRRRAPRVTAEVDPPVVQRVDPGVMQTARDLAGGDMARVEIRSTGEVVVHNQAGWSRRH